VRERSPAIACLYAANPAAALIGSPLAGWLLGVHWHSFAGWRWLFILEGIPAIVVGIVTYFYMTDWPAQAGWLPQDERDWLAHELQAELQAKNKDTKLHNHGGVLRPASCQTDCRVLPGCHRSSRNHLLDTDLR
jgi:MFS transporter, ACS family, tartrate transporter